MKKISILTFVFIVIGIITLLAFTQEKVTMIDNPEMYVVKFDVLNCSNCSSISYCIDGGDINYPGACTFGWDNCPGGDHSIFVQCGNKTGQAQFYCQGGIALIVYVTVNENGPQNPCSAKH